MWASEQFPGTRRFTVEAHLGAGAMGVVYRVRDVERGEVVALKTMVHVTPEALLQFKKEFRSLADISHPNVVQLYELSTEGEHWFFTMELVDGGDLLSWIHGALFGLPRALRHDQVEKLRGAFLQLASGLVAIHAAGKLHRDIKPSNILVSRSGRVVLLDFGVAEDVSDRADAGTRSDPSLTGTPAYMAPEQARMLRATPASDWYSVGCVMYEALTGRLPFDGPATTVLLQKQKVLPPRPSTFVSEIPADLEELAMDLLAPDPRARPTGAQVLDRLSAASQSAAEVARLPSTPSELPFVGRRKELDVLRDAFDASARGHVVVMLHGRSGMGKSALASRFLEEVSQEHGTLVLSGRCYEREAVPFKAVDPLVDELRRWLSRLPDAEVHALLPRDLDALVHLFPVLGDLDGGWDADISAHDRVDPPELRRRAFVAMRDLLANIARTRRLVLHIDDLQWCDADSEHLLEALVAQPSPPWMLICAHRSVSEQPPDVLRELRRTLDEARGACTRVDVELGELALAEAEELARTIVEMKDPSLATLVTAEAGGNPLFVTELARWANERAGTAHVASGLSLEQVILERVARLPEDARALLETLSVASGPLTHGVAVRASRIDALLRTPALALRGAKLVVTRGLGDEDSIETAHDRVRRAVADCLDEERRKACHARIAHALRDDPKSDPEAIFEHYRAAGDRERARASVLAAAEAADRSLAFARAARLYRMAVELEAASLDALHRRLGDALANAGAVAEAAEAYLAGARYASPDDALELRRLAAEGFLESNRNARGLEVLRSVLDEVGLGYQDSPRRVLASFVWHQAKLRVAPLRRRLEPAQRIRKADLARIDAAFTASTGLALSDPLRGADYASRALLLALEAREPVRLGRTLAVAAWNAAARGEPARARAESLVHAAERVAMEIGEPHTRALALLAGGTVHFLLGEWLRARAKLDSAEEILRSSCRGVAWELANAQSRACNVLILSGDLHEASRRAPPLMAEARHRDDHFALMNLVYPACVGRIVADDLEGALEIAKYGESGDPHVLTLGRWAAFISACSVMRYRGDGAAAWRRTFAESRPLEGSMLWRSAMVRVFSLYERGLSAISGAVSGYQKKRALEAADRWALALSSEKLRYAPALGLLLRAGTHAARRDHDRALAALDQAIPRLDAADLRYLAACARSRKGELIGGAAGRDLAREADAFFSAQGIVCVERCLAMSAPGF